MIQKVFQYIGTWVTFYERHRSCINYSFNIYINCVKKSKGRQN